MKNKFTLLFSLATIAFSFSALAQVSYSQDFEGAGTSLPSGWSQVSLSIDGGFIVGNASSLSSAALTFPATSNFVATNDDGCGQECNKSNELLSSPSLDFSSLSNPFLNIDIFYLDQTYQGATEQATIEVSTDNGVTWTVVADLTGSTEWRTEFINLSDFANSSAVKIGLRYKDGGGWLYGLGIDNFSIFTPEPNSADLIALDINAYIVQTANSIAGTVFNSGALPLNSLDVSYTVSSGSPVNATINGLNIAPFSFGDFTHPIQWTPASSGVFNISLTISQPNGQTDPVLTNNSFNRNVSVATQSVQRLPLIEEFTSSTCPPCASFNFTFNPLLEQFQVNSGPDALSAIVKYQMNYPSPGNDPSFNLDASTRSSFYGVPGIPDPYLDGTNVPASSAFIQDAVQTRRSDIAVMSIAVDAISKGDSLIADVTVTPYASFPAGFRLYIAVTEDRYDFTGSNGETEFHYVMRKMLPSGTGITLTAMTPNTPLIFTRKHKFTYSPNGNPTQNSFSLWADNFADVTVVAWVQDPNTLEIFQAAFDESVTSVTGINDDENSLEARFYPNPSNETTFMKVNVPSTSRVSLEVFNIMGQRVDFQNYGTHSSGAQTFKFDSSNLINGIYLFNLVVGDKKVTRKVSVNH